MALLRAAGLCRLALRAQWASLRLLSSAAGGELPAAEDKPGRRVNLEALRQDRSLRPPSDRTPAARPVAMLPEAGFAPRPTQEQRQLNQELITCTAIDDVLDLVASRWAIVNCVTLSTALSVIARLAGKREPALWLKDDKRFRLLMRGALTLMERQEMSARCFSNMLYACGQLGVAAPTSWLRVYWERSAAVIDDFKPQHFSNTLYACGQLGLTLSDYWLERFWHASAAKLGDFKPQELSNTIYACRQLHIAPPEYWLARFWHASAATLGDFKPQELSNTLYACVQLGSAPPDYWLPRFWLACDATLGAWIAQDFSNTIYACGQLDLTPPTDWLLRFWEASALKLGDFVPQALSNTIYACGQLGVTPPADWMWRFWLVSAATLGDWNAQDFSNTIYACGQLGITPPADWLQRFWHASALKLGDFTPQNLSNTLYACGQLGVTPPGDWLERFSSAFEQALPDMSQQHLANTAIALATLALWELPLWRGLWARLCSSLPPDTAGWSAEDRINAMQMYQAYQAAAVERPGLLPAPSPELIAAGRKSWIDQARDGEGNSRAGSFHAGVSACLMRMGVAHTNEHLCDRADRSIDIAIEGATPVAVEVDGPTHFLQDGRPNGSTLLRNRTLAAHGWRVAAVDYRVWDALRTQEQQDQYLRRLLAS